MHQRECKICDGESLVERGCESLLGSRRYESLAVSRCESFVESRGGSLGER